MSGEVTKRRFDDVYDEWILGRQFVEHKAYYVVARERYWKSFQQFMRLPVKPGDRLLDIGGGQFGILASKLLGVRAVAGDTVDTAAADVREAGLEFMKLDLFAERLETETSFDVITMLEVIEHIPQPPYVVFRKLRELLKPGGLLFLTTPNGFRIRNVVYMLLNKEVLDIYRYPQPGQILGHQHEYTLRQMRWQLGEAGFEVLLGEQVNNQSSGHSLQAKLARLAFAPVNVFPHLRNALMIGARAPGAA